MEEDGRVVRGSWVMSQILLTLNSSGRGCEDSDGLLGYESALPYPGLQGERMLGW